MLVITGAAGAARVRGRISPAHSKSAFLAQRTREMGHQATNAIEQRRSTWISVAEILPVRAVVAERGRRQH